MSFDSSRHRLSLPAISYLTILFGMGMMFFVMLGVMVWREGAALNTQILEMKRQAVQQEINTATRLMLDDLERVKQTLLTWDEVRQQLSDPSYYDYWYTNRLRQTVHYLPSYIDGVEIYRHDGIPLRSVVQVEMPDRFGNAWQGALIRNQANGPAVYYGFPIKYADNAEALGYIILRLSLQRALRETGALLTIDPADLQYNLPEQHTVPVTRLQEYLILPQTETPAAVRLSNLIRDTLRDFLLAGALFSIIVWAMVVYLYVRPLRRLSFYLDGLRDRGRHSPLIPRYGWFSMVEVDKAYHSLNVYHQQLDDRNAALRSSEQQLRMILDNVPDGVVALDDTDTILSCNPAACELFAARPQDLIGKKFSDIVVVRDDAGGDTQGMRQDGSVFTAEATLSESNGDNEPRIVIIRDITDRKLAEERLIQLANYDSLTGMPNRTLMRDRLAHALQLARRNHSLVGLFFLDLDRFKTINDTLGHPFGDELLKHVAERIRNTVRDSDTVARLGGDEFTVIVENVHDTAAFADVAQNIINSVSEPMTISGQMVAVSTSVGITVYPKDGTDPDLLIKNADTAMYRAKEMGGGAYQYFTHEMSVQGIARLELERELRKAWANNQLEVYYQPRWDMHSKRLTALEALLRWPNSNMGCVTPDRFISILEDTGLVILVGEWVLRTACGQMRGWIDAGSEPLRIAVNLSTRQFTHKDLVESIRRVLTDTGIDPEKLEFEITEATLMENLDIAGQVLEQFRLLGVKTTLDGFGSGQASLNCLMRFPIGSVKIDRSFIAAVPQDPYACMVTQAIIALSKSMKLRAVAQGIETAEQLSYLQQQGCDEGQGNIRYAPMTAADMESLLTVSQV